MGWNRRYIAISVLAAASALTLMHGGCLAGRTAEPSSSSLHSGSSSTPTPSGHPTMALCALVVMIGIVVKAQRHRSRSVIPYRYTTVRLVRLGPIPRRARPLFRHLCVIRT